MSAVRILLVEPDPAVSARIGSALRTRFYDVFTTQGGAQAISLLDRIHFDLVILDRRLPDMEGCDLCCRIRQFDCSILLLMLDSGNDHVMEGFAAGADEYVVLPMDDRELLARLGAMMRRTLPVTPMNNLIRVGEIVMDLDSKVVSLGERVVAVTASEFLLLEYMIRNKNRVVSKDELATCAWSKGRKISPGRLPMHMNNLRNKLEDGVHPDCIYTVSGKGYLLVENGTLTAAH